MAGIALALGTVAALAVASGARRGSRATVPLPSSFPSTEPGLLTREEFLTLRNPEGKYHAEHAYERAAKALNADLVVQGTTSVRGHDYTFLRAQGDPEGREGWTIQRDDVVVGVVHEGTLYHGIRPPLSEIPRYFVDTAGFRSEVVHLGVERTERVKYPAEYVGRVSQVGKRNRARFPVVLRNLVVDGEPMQVRAERKPETNAGVTLVVLDRSGRIVAVASDEWGATLIAAAPGARGKGLGQVLGPIWYRYNPRFLSGGFTRSGEANAIRMWEARVREFAAKGWYSALVRARRIEPARVRAILGGLSHRPRRPGRLPSPRPQAPPTELRVYAEDHAFVVYDARFLDDPDERWIYGYGFFRDAPRVGVFLYTIDYDRPYREIVTLVALQMARDAGDRLWIGPEYGDVLELDGLPHVKRVGDYVEVDRDVLPLRTLAAKERQARRKVDRHGEKQAMLLEMAESKWG